MVNPSAGLNFFERMDMIRCFIVTMSNTSALSVYLAIEKFTDGKGLGAFPSRATIAQEAGVSIRTVTRSIKDLAGFGLITVEVREGTTHLYTINGLKSGPLPEKVAENSHHTEEQDTLSDPGHGVSGGEPNCPGRRGTVACDHTPIDHTPIDPVSAGTVHLNTNENISVPSRACTEAVGVGVVSNSPILEWVIEQFELLTNGAELTPTIENRLAELAKNPEWIIREAFHRAERQISEIDWPLPWLEGTIKNILKDAESFGPYARRTPISKFESRAGAQFANRAPAPILPSDPPVVAPAAECVERPVSGPAPDEKSEVLEVAPVHSESVAVIDSTPQERKIEAEEAAIAANEFNEVTMMVNESEPIVSQSEPSDLSAPSPETTRERVSEQETQFEYKLIERPAPPPEYVAAEVATAPELALEVSSPTVPAPPAVNSGTIQRPTTEILPKTPITRVPSESLVRRPDSSEDLPSQQMVTDQEIPPEYELIEQPTAPEYVASEVATTPELALEESPSHSVTPSSDPAVSEVPPSTLSAAASLTPEEANRHWSLALAYSPIPSNHKRWLRGSHVQSVMDGVIVIALASAEALDWCQNRLAKQIRRQFSVLAGGPVAIQFAVSEAAS